MQGYAALWVPGTDHAGIATQIKVEEDLRENEGLTRYDLGREKFLERVWALEGKVRQPYRGAAEEAGRLLRLGAAPASPWTRAAPRLCARCSVSLYEKGLIYKGSRIINWCPHCVTALSDAEVEYADKPGHLWHMRYPLADGSG